MSQEKKNKEEKNAVQQMFAELADCFNRNDLEGAESCTDRWLQAAREQENWQMELTVLNEQIGFFRKTGKVKRGTETIRRAFWIIEQYGIDSTEAAATTWLNGATAYRAFGEYGKAEKYFKKTLAFYETHLKEKEYHLASLYNNLALLKTDQKKYTEAEAYMEKALGLIKTDPKSQAEAATTCMSMAYMYRSMDLPVTEKQNKICKYLDRAWELLENQKELPDSYYAYVCKNGAGMFRLFGREEQADRMQELAETYYRTQEQRKRAGIKGQE
ncbi:MAG: tetratricopeptide repeat protein [Eubacterium sp.]|nr:tetratricopeptide repeat protein [Eubacterium sp.]